MSARTSMINYISYMKTNKYPMKTCTSSRRTCMSSSLHHGQATHVKEKALLQALLF